MNTNNETLVCHYITWPPLYGIQFWLVIAIVSHYKFAPLNKGFQKKNVHVLDILFLQETKPGDTLHHQSNQFTITIAFAFV